VAILFALSGLAKLKKEINISEPKFTITNKEANLSDIIL
jgi:hypothetical protein